MSRQPLLRDGRWTWGLSAYLVLLAGVGFWPSPVDKPLRGTLASALDSMRLHGAPGWLDYNFVEVTANIVLFVPLGYFALRALPRARWWQLAGLGILLSTLIELGQMLLLSDRYPSLVDIVANTSGALAGLVLASGTGAPSRRERAATP